MPRPQGVNKHRTTKRPNKPTHQSLIDEIINSVNFLAERAVGSVEKGLQSLPPANLGFKAPPPPKARNKPTPTDDVSSSQTPELLASHEIENGTHQLETLLFASIDRNFDKFEIYVMRNILSFRPNEPKEWLRLGHYEGLDFDAPGQGGGGEGDDRPSVESIHRLRRRLQASQQLNVMLHAERARNEGLLGELRGLLGSGGKEMDRMPKVEPGVAEGANGEEGERPPLAFLRDQGGLTAGGTEKPLETTTAFTLSQMQALRELSRSLRSILPGLGEDGGGKNEEEEDEGGRKSWRRERMEFVETQTRKHLEQSRGLELGPDGEVRDGEWQGEGKGLATEEVEGLERVVAMLGDGEGNRDGTGEEMDDS